MKKILCVLMAMVMLLAFVGCAGQESTTTAGTDATSGEAEATTTATEDSEPKTAAFVILGLGNDFFVALSEAFEAGFQAAGWETSLTSGEFNPQTQITAVENYIALGVDVIFIWGSQPGALDTVAQQAMDAGVKVVAFVQTLENYDAAMLSDDTILAKDEVYLASKWVDETFPDAEAGSVPCALVSMDSTEVTKTQAEVIKNMISEYNPKIEIVTVYDVDGETVEAGVTAAETIYTEYPEVKLFLTVNASPALGLNNYFTGLSSPVTDYSEMGIFTINGGTELFDPIKASATDEAPLRGTVITSGIAATVADMLDIATGVVSGDFSDKYTRYAANVFVNADTIAEYEETGAVTSLVEADFTE